MTKIGRPFVSFAFPDELFPRVKDSINLYKAELRLMTIDTERGLVVLSPVDDNWILTVLYVPELQLGLAIAKTKNVLRLLEGIELPPPPEEFEESSESNIQVLESIAINAASVESVEPAEAQPAPEVETVTPVSTEESSQPPAVDLPPPEAFNVQPVTVPERGPQYSTALSLESQLYGEMKTLYRNFGFDVLMLVDGNITVEQIADSMFQSNERVIDLLKWGASKGIITVPHLSEDEVVPAETKGSLGRYVKCPRFEGDIGKVVNEDQQVIRMCDGSRTTEQIAEFLKLPLPTVVQTVAKYRKHGLKLIGKTL